VCERGNEAEKQQKHTPTAGVDDADGADRLIAGALGVVALTAVAQHVLYLRSKTSA
jgi:hypothetical protein